MKLKQIENERCCHKCQFWQGDIEINWGECHRYPPQFWSEFESSGSAFPSTKPNDWCGEFRCYPSMLRPISEIEFK